MQQTKRGGGRGARASTEQQDGDVAEPSAFIQTYQLRYEALQQERLRSRRQRVSEQFFSPSASAADSDIERMSEGFQDAVGFLTNRYDDSATPQYAVNDREEETHMQQSQQWSYAEHGDDESREHHSDDGEDVFDLPPVDNFAREQQQQNYQQYEPFQSALSEQQGVPVASEEFVDAATYLEKNQLGGDDSFEEDVDHQAQWERQDESVLESEGGRPSDFFEKRSRNMERVEFALENDAQHNNFEEEQISLEDGRHEEEYSSRCLNQQPARAQSALLDESLTFSDSNTAFSSGYEVHFDSARHAFTPNSLKYLQEKSRKRAKPLAVHEEEPQLEVAVQYENEARNGTQRPDNHRLAPDDAEFLDELPESIQAMQRGPGIIVEALNEIDALISNPPLHAQRIDNGGRRGRGTSSINEIVREYDMSLETGLPLSRTTDSWGDDPEEEVTAREETPVHSPVRSRENRPSTSNEPAKHRRGELASELNTIRESRFSSISTVDNSNQLYRINEECDISVSSAHTGETIPTSGGCRPFEAPYDEEHEEFSSRHHAESDSASTSQRSNPSTHRNGSMQCRKLGTNRNEENLTPRKANCGVHFSDSNRNAVGDARISNRDAGVASSHTEVPRIGLERLGKQSASVPKRHVNESRLRSTSQTGSSRQLYNSIDVTSSLRSRQEASQRILPHRTPKENDIEGLAINPIQLSRRCRRLLCTVGEVMTERIVFSNGSNSVGRICVSLLPLSTGCQQFSVSPAVLELAPRASSSFHVTFEARTAGVAAGIFQFRGIGVESLFAPYEVLIEASVRRNLELNEYDVAGKFVRIGNNQSDRHVEELRQSKCINEVEIGPTFVKFERLNTNNGVKSISSATVKITNNTEDTQPFKINCSHENLKITPESGSIPPASEAIVTLLPLSRPHDQRQNGESFMSTRSVSSPANWTGSFTVAVGKTVSREISFVISRDVMGVLPPFDAIARSRHQISSQTDSFYYTKKRNRKGLYFHARAVECGSCNVGESHQVPVYICNGSNSPMTVFLQDLMDPFSCFYTTTTIEPRKFIEVPVTFTPKVAGKVSTSLFAYSVTDKAVVTLVARGI